MKKRNLTLAATDVVGVGLAYFGALYLRFEGLIPPEYLNTFWHVLPWFTLLVLATYWATGLYRLVWEYASTGELYAVLRGVTLASVTVITIAYIIMYPLLDLEPLPRSIYLVAWAFLVFLVGGARLFQRFNREFRHYTSIVSDAQPSAILWLTSLLKNGSPSYRESAAVAAGREWGNGSARPLKKTEAQNFTHKRVLIAGAGEAGAMVLRELRNHPDLGMEPVGFVDDSPRKVGLRLMGAPILGRREDIPSLVKKRHIDQVIIAMPSAPGSVRREVVNVCSGLSVEVRTLPGVYELIDGRVSIKQIREVRLEDLLGREPVRVNLTEIAGYLSGKTALITGAGGSIGSELCRQIARFNPARLVLVECSENNLFEIEHELAERWPALALSPEFVDVRDRPGIDQIFARHRPAVVFHAAAYKHVPLSERWPEQTFVNNVIGTYNVASIADHYNSEVFIFISTDKAVNPTSVMGATKRAAELIIQDFAHRSKTRFAAVRFGNVLGSSGSVVNIFRQQIARGGPVTVTHPDMERYFMTTPEAVQLIIQAGAYARGGEIFVLDMGERLQVLDLAREMIRLSGFKPGRDIEIKFTGVRPGEKLREELFYSKEKAVPTGHARIFVVENHYRFAGCFPDTGSLTGADAVQFLRRIVPEWRTNQVHGSDACGVGEGFLSTGSKG